MQHTLMSMVIQDYAITTPTINGAKQYNCSGNISACPAPLKTFWVDYGNKMLDALDALPVLHGAYVHNCQQHFQTSTGSPWATDTVNGTVMHAAAATWYSAAIKGTQGIHPSVICDGK